jgi:spore germination protein YaaH
MDQINTIANTIIKLDTATEKKPEEQKNMTELLEEFRCLSDTTSLLQIAMQEEISSVIGTSNRTRGHSNLSEFFKNVLRHTKALKSFTVKQGM